MHISDLEYHEHRRVFPLQPAAAAGEWNIQDCLRFNLNLTSRILCLYFCRRCCCLPLDWTELTLDQRKH
jgi:hypothetical protein